MSSVSYLPVNVNHANGFIYENVLQNKFLLKMNKNYFELSSGEMMLHVNYALQKT